MKKGILQLSLLASALFLVSPFSLAAESAAATMAEILVNLNHFPSDADKDRLADIMESDETSDAEVDIAMAISHIAHQAKDEDKEMLNEIIADESVPAELRDVAAAVLRVNHKVSDEDMAKLKMIASSS